MGGNTGKGGKPNGMANAGKAVGKGGASAKGKASANDIVHVGMEMSGTVKKWTPGAFGFITCEEIGTDIWVGMVSLAEGQPEPSAGGTVSFTLAQKNHKLQAAEG